MQTVDCRGLACPEPVIRTKRALDSISVGVVVSIVDNRVARENILRLVDSLGLQATVDEQDNLIQIEIAKGSVETPTPVVATREYEKIALLVTSNLFGKGEAALGEALMKSFFYALTENDRLPTEIFFVNSAVKLTCAGSGVLERIKQLAANGVQIMSCGTCLDFYQLKEQLAVGEVTNMYTIVESITKADKTITL